MAALGVVPDALHRARRLPASVWLAVGGGLLAIALGSYTLALPRGLTGVHGLLNRNGYDDGVYLGTALRLVHGHLPYRDYAFVHPPGITLLMTPIALLGRVIGSRDALAIARIVTVLVAGVN